MDQIQAEIEAILSQIEVLQRERDAITGSDILPENDSPEAIAQAYRHQARVAAQVSAEVNGIDNAIAALENQLQHKQRQLRQLQVNKQPLRKEELLEEALQSAYERADRINELARELAEELRELKAIAYDLSPSYWQLYHKPFITGLKGVSVPFFRSDGNVLMLTKFII
ncbi:MAG: hypothetical protein F6K36_01940 [Symploca sp. SIO3C6]|nr:hypothetical protein [Symploca sp. SIO3C6]